nr:hypothetical protein E2R29_33250 [Burkholderia pseudomallei]
MRLGPPRRASGRYPSFSVNGLGSHAIFRQLPIRPAWRPGFPAGRAVGPADRKPFSVRHFRTRRFRMSLCRLARRAAMPASPHMRLVRAPRFARRAGMPVFGATRATAAAPPAAD